MRIFKSIIFVAVALLISCQKEISGVDKLPMQVAPTLAGETKGSLTTADLTDFYLQIVSDDAAYSYFEHASKDGSGAWTTPSKLFWKNETSPVSYCAARFGAFAFTSDQFKNGVDLEIPADQRTHEQLNAADLLTLPAASKKYEDTTGGILPVTLSHGLAKVTFTLTLGPKFYDNLYTRGPNPVKDFTVKGTGTGFNFQPQTGTVSVKSDPQANVLPLAGAFTPATAEAKSATAAYEAILVPQTLPAGALKVTFKVGDYDYEWSNAAAITLEAGKTYDLTVSVTAAPPVDPYNGHAYVNMGNGLKWATCNVGAENPEDYGDYFAWGETAPKAEYNWGTYQWMEDGQSSWKRITKYTFADNQKDGTWWYDGDTFKGDKGDGVEHKDFASYDYEDDAARANWDGNWRTPTDAEWTWLRENCTWDWKTTDDGYAHNGMLVTSNINGNTIFLPAAGGRDNASLANDGSSGYYWSSSLTEDYSGGARYMYIFSGGVYRNTISRSCGHSVRPVND